MILDLFLITVIVCFIVDLSGIVEYVKKAVFRFIAPKKEYDPEFTLKPIDCSLCMSFWCGIIYLIITGNISILSVFYVSLLSYFSESVTVLLTSVQFTIQYLIGKITP